MPELPEVQTIVSDLNKVLPGLVIWDVWCDSPKLIKSPKNFEEFKKNITSKKILGLRRRGKNILIDFSDNFVLLIHQKMTGHLLYGKYEKIELEKKEKWRAIEKGPLSEDPYNSHIHFILELSNGMKLALSDVRKFAKIILGKKEEIENLSEFKSLGIEPFDKNFIFFKFQEIISKKSGKIKQVLMDQKNIAGIGNIYADEILWEADVHPARTAKKLSEKELENIHTAILKVLKIAIKEHGDSMSDYRRPSGKKGNYQNMQNAYRQTGNFCKKNDNGIIKRIKIGQRSTHFCSVHQK